MIVVALAKQLDIVGVQLRATVAPFDNVVGNHPMFAAANFAPVAALALDLRHQLSPSV